jgi:diacylglycerol kinase (ATP)
MSEPAQPAEIAPPLVHSSSSRSRVDAATRWLVIRNPAAGRARALPDAWRSFERALHAAGVTFDVQATGRPGDAAHIAETAASTGRARILVAGGDGTVHEALNGLMRARKESSTAHAPDTMLVPVPLGTGNDWARSLALPRDPDRLAALIAHGQPVAHDVGMISFAGPGQPRCWFINVAGAGFDAHVLERLPASAPSKAAYLLGALRELGRYRATNVRVVCDDAPVPASKLLVAFVAIGRYCGHGMHLAPQAGLDDGRFDVVTVADVGLLRALPKLFALYTRGVLDDPLVRYATATSVHVDSQPPAAVEADGQLVGTTPATFTVVPRTLYTLRGP